MATSRSADSTPGERFTPFAALVTECSARLAPVVNSCGRDPAEFDRLVAVVDAIESDCDEAGMAAAEALTDPMEPAFDRAYLQNADLLMLVRCYDRVASLAERFVKELAAVGPDLPDAVRTRMCQIARMAHDAAACLERTAVPFVTGDDAAVTEAGVRHVRELEDACDEAKYDCIRLAFEEADPATALVCKDLVTRLDEVVNAAEDTADHLVYVASKPV